MYLGLYTCAGTETCKGKRPGSYGHYELDAQTLASWGVDMVKMDHCGVPGGASDVEMYSNMSRALNATQRPMLFSLCQWGENDVEEWGPGVSQMYRIAADHLPLWSCPSKICGGSGAGLGQGTREIIEFMAVLQPSRYTRQFAWMDPDFLMTLYFPTMDFTASRTEYSFWALWSAPLLVSTDVRNLSQEKKEIISNAEVIAVNQDVSYTAGDRLSNATDGSQVRASVCTKRRCSACERGTFAATTRVTSG
jgi:alpha-galactosidase